LERSAIIVPKLTLGRETRQKGKLVAKGLPGHVCAVATFLLERSVLW